MVDRLGSEHFRTHLELKGGGILTYFSFSSKTICSICSGSSVAKIAQFDKGMRKILGFVAQFHKGMGEDIGCLV